MSSAEPIDEFQSWLHRRGRGRSAAVYTRTLRGYLNDPEAYEEKLTDSSYSPNYRRFLAATLRAYAKFSRDEDLREKLDEIRMPAPVPKEAREPFSMEEWLEIQQEVDEADYLPPAARLVCGVVVVRGIRSGDVLRATCAEVRSALKTDIFAFEGKGERRQEYSVEPFREYFEGLLGLRGARGKTMRVRDLVCSSGKQNAASTAIRRAFTRIAVELEIDPKELYAHRFRHTYATHFLQAMKGDPEAVFKLQQQMGWARLDTAGNYLRRSRKTELDAIETELLKGRKRKRGKK